MEALAIQNVPFYQDTIPSCIDNNKIVWSVVSIICKNIGLSENQKERQVKNIQKDLLLSRGCKKLTLKFEGQVREALCVNNEYLPMWLAKISVTPTMKKENPETAEKLLRYQIEAKNVLAEHYGFKEKENKQEVAVQKTPSDPLDREEIAALMLCVKEGNDLLLTGQLNVMTAMKDMFTDFIKAQAEFNNNVMNTINTLAQTMATSQKSLPVKEEVTYVVPKTEIAWKSDVFKKVNKYAKDNSSAPQSVLGKIYKRMKNKGINLDSYMDKYREETGSYNNTVINVIAHYDELRTEFEKELGALCNGENQEIPMSISAEAMKTPKAISSLVEQLKPKFGKTNSVVMRRVYKRFEEKTGTSLNIQRSLLAKNLGISNCSKAYAIYSDEKLMNTLMQVIKEMYEEV